MADTRPCAVCGKELGRRQAQFCSRACYWISLRQPLEERFWKFVGAPSADGCRVWTGARDEQGRGHFGFGSRTTVVKAHRMAYELAVGPIPPGMKVCHSCDNPPCCEPTHLFLGTQADNVADMVRKGRSHQQQKTHCPRGHEYTPENTRLYKTGRYCRKCMVIHVKNYRQRKKENADG